MRKYRKWEHRKKFSWKKRMKHVRSGKDVVRDENNNTVHENDNYNIIYRDGCELWPFPYEMSVFFYFYTSLDRRGEAYNSDPVICGIAGLREPSTIPTIGTGKKPVTGPMALAVRCTRHPKDCDAVTSQGASPKPRDAIVSDGVLWTVYSNM